MSKLKRVRKNDLKLLEAILWLYCKDADLTLYGVPTLAKHYATIWQLCGRDPLNFSKCVWNLGFEAVIRGVTRAEMYSWAARTGNLFPSGNIPPGFVLEKYRGRRGKP